MAKEHVNVSPGNPTHDVLLVDNDAIAVMLAERQMRDSCLTMRTCKTASEAIELLQTTEVRLLLVDLHMAPMNGLELLELLCAQGRLNTMLAYLFTSAVPESAVIQRLDSLGIKLLLKADMLKVDSIANLLDATP